MLEVPPEWNEVPDLIMEDKDILPSTEAAVKGNIDEVAWGRRKLMKNEHDHVGET